MVPEVFLTYDGVRSSRWRFLQHLVPPQAEQSVPNPIKKSALHCAGICNAKNFIKEFQVKNFSLAKSSVLRIYFRVNPDLAAGQHHGNVHSLVGQCVKEVFRNRSFFDRMLTLKNFWLKNRRLVKTARDERSSGRRRQRRPNRRRRLDFRFVDSERRDAENVDVSQARNSGLGGAKDFDF